MLDLIQDGNLVPVETEDDLYDANGFSMTPPYYHEDTATMYNEAGI